MNLVASSSSSISSDGGVAIGGTIGSSGSGSTERLEISRVSSSSSVGAAANAGSPIGSTAGDKADVTGRASEATARLTVVRSASWSSGAMLSGTVSRTYCARNGPICTMSPGLSVCSAVFVPLTNTPLRLPRSLTTTSSPAETNSA